MVLEYAGEIFGEKPISLFFFLNCFSSFPVGKMQTRFIGLLHQHYMLSNRLQIYTDRKSRREKQHYISLGNALLI